MSARDPFPFREARDSQKTFRPWIRRAVFCDVALWYPAQQVPQRETRSFCPASDPFPSFSCSSCRFCVIVFEASSHVFLWYLCLCLTQFEEPLCHLITKQLYHPIYRCTILMINTTIMIIENKKLVLIWTCKIVTLNFLLFLIRVIVWIPYVRVIGCNVKHARAHTHIYSVLTANCSLFQI